MRWPRLTIGGARRCHRHRAECLCHGITGSVPFLRGRPGRRRGRLAVLSFPPARRDTRARILSTVMRRARPLWYVESSPPRMSWYNRVLPTPSRKHACRGDTDKGSRSLSPLRPVTPGWMNGMCSPYLSRTVACVRRDMRGYAAHWQQLDVELLGPSCVRPLFVGRSYVRPMPLHPLADGISAESLKP